MDTSRSPAPTALSLPSRSGPTDGPEVGPGGSSALVLRPEVDADALRTLLDDRRALVVGIALLPFVVAMSTIRLSTPWGLTAVALAVLVAGLAVRSRIRRRSRRLAAIETGGPTVLLLATCVPSRAGWRLDLATDDGPDRVVASVRDPVLGTAVARFADQEASRTPSPETLRRAPWRAWHGEPVLVVGGPSARAVTALRAADGGPWVLSISRRTPVRRDARTTGDSQEVPA